MWKTTSTLSKALSTYALWRRLVETYWAWPDLKDLPMSPFSSYGSRLMLEGKSMIRTANISHLISISTKWQAARPQPPVTTHHFFSLVVALMMISVLKGVTLTSTPKYPSSTNSLINTSLSSARKTPSATNFRFLLIWARAVNFVFLFFSTQLSLS